MKTAWLVLLCVLFAGIGMAGDFDLDPTPRNDRVTYRVASAVRGYSSVVPEGILVRFCSDIDGCKLRLGMFNWDGTKRVASRESLFYYNRINRAWRASLDDKAGTDADRTTQHVMNAWACYFTDGRYSNWTDRGDIGVDFGLLSWREFEADCFLTIID